MKRFLVAFCTIVVMFFLCAPVTAHADEADDLHSEMSQEIDDVLESFDLGISVDSVSDLSFTELCIVLKEKTLCRLEAPVHLLMMLLVVIVLTASMKSIAGGALTGTSGELYSMVSVLSAVAVTEPQLLEVYSGMLEDITLCGDFILVFIPVFSAIAAICGGLTSAGAYHMLMLGASEMIVQLSDTYLLPLLGTFTALAAAGSVFPENSLESVASMLKKLSTWVITLTMTLFTGFLTLKCSITSKADTAVTKTVKMVVSGAVPIVGGAVSDAFGSVRGSFEVLFSTAGGAGIVGISLIVLPKIIEIFAYRAVMWVGSAAAEIFSADAPAKLLKSFDSALAVAQCVLICYLLMFVVSSAILCRSF